jgi:hypothetical protein
VEDSTAPDAGLPPSARFKSFLATGGISAVVAGIGDFFTPANGWVVLLLVGFASLMFVLYMLVTGGRGKLTNYISRKDKNLAAWWRGPVLLQHGWHVVGLFGLICVLVGFRSHDAKDQGGVLAGNVSALSEMQVMSGLMRAQAETTAAVKDLAKVVKKETSDDPQKELANRGIQWTSQAALEALRSNNARAIDLFLQGGFDFAGDTGLKFATARLFDPKDWPRRQPTVERLSASGMDMMGAYADDPNHEYLSPLGIALTGGAPGALEWLLENGDHRALDKYSDLASVLLSGGMCTLDAGRVDRLAKLASAGLPANRDPGHFTTAYARWFQLKNALPPLNVEGAAIATELKACERVLPLLQPTDAAQTRSLQAKAKAIAKQDKRNEMTVELQCLDTALASEIYEGDIIPRGKAARDAEPVPYYCPETESYGGYKMVPAGQIRAARARMLGYISTLDAL